MVGFWISILVIYLVGRPLYRKYREYVVPFPAGNREILKRYFEYYLALDPQDKTRFERKVQQFIRMKEFVPRKMKEVTNEMKVLISACAIQLTFGLPGVYLQHFKRILVYPDNYYSLINKTYHKGEVNPRFGIIVLSWKAFVNGYIEKEGINLGLHEMAHALHLENVIHNDEADFLDPAVLKNWDHLAGIEIDKIKKGDNSFFREYGASDPHEFFAVAVENFFERPEEFKVKSPELYSSMSRLLNQDPEALYA